jgi:hypothetical protein
MRSVVLLPHPDELTVIHIEIDAIDGYLCRPFSINFTDTVERYARHCLPSHPASTE